MRKKALSLALALVLCLGLTVPVLAAEPFTCYVEYPIGLGSNETGMVVDITNVLDYYWGEDANYYNCVAPVKIGPKAIYDREHKHF